MGKKVIPMVLNKSVARGSESACTIMIGIKNCSVNHKKKQRKIPRVIQKDKMKAKTFQSAVHNGFVENNSLILMYRNDRKKTGRGELCKAIP